MAKSDLFNITLVSTAQPEEIPGEQEVSEPPHGTQAGGKTAVGVINSKQSAITFAGAPVFVTLMWRVLGAAVPGLEASKLCALVLSIFVALAIYAVSEASGETGKEKFAGYVYAFINSFAIAAAVLGIDTTLSGVSLIPLGQ